MTTFFLITAWLCIAWSVLSFACAVITGAVKNQTVANRNEALSIGWLVAAALFFQVAAMPG